MALWPCRNSDEAALPFQRQDVGRRDLDEPVHVVEHLATGLAVDAVAGARPRTAGLRDPAPAGPEEEHEAVGEWHPAGCVPHDAVPLAIGGMQAAGGRDHVVEGAGRRHAALLEQIAPCRQQFDRDVDRHPEGASVPRSCFPDDGLKVGGVDRRRPDHVVEGPERTGVGELGAAMEC